MTYKIKYRNKMFGYKKYFTLNLTFDSKEEALDWIDKNKEPYIDKIEVVEENENG